MPYYIGTDEAGYGPNLGPLVITATVWEAPVLRRGDLYHRLGKAIAPEPCEVCPGRLPLAIADSKQLYKAPQGLGLLERGVLACLGLIDINGSCGHRLWRRLEPACTALDCVPWHAGAQLEVPLAAEAEDVTGLVPRLHAALEDAGVRLVRVICRSLFPAEFNELVERYGNKAEALSRCTLELVAEVLSDLPPGPANIVCDKHGGRNRYAPLLQRLFPDVLIEVACESREASIYRWGPKEARCEAQFRAGGESALPTALASMVSKYLRELSMHAFNAYWRRYLPELRPTAGYPGDARRFKQEIAQVQQSLGIEDRLLWRER